MRLDEAPNVKQLEPLLERVFELACQKVIDLDRSWDPARGAPVFTVQGKYTTRGWTEWTEGFQYGCALLCFDATGQRELLELGRSRTIERMAQHLTHIGVHDHGFNTISTFGQLRRLALEGRFEPPVSELKLYELAIRVSGAVQAARWTSILDDDGRRSTGFIHSFCGQHSLFSDTIRTLRVLALAWRLGQVLMAENDRRVSLLARLAQHGLTTARYNVYYGEGRDVYDVEPGRVAHESLFNVTDGRYRCPSTQQGYSPFSTWTRALAWILLGYAEQLEFLAAIEPDRWRDEMQRHLAAAGCGESDAAAKLIDKQYVTSAFLRAAEATAEWYIRHSFADGMVFWDSGAPGLPPESDWSQQRSDPYAVDEPIDSSAAAIAAQGFLRLGNYCGTQGDKERAKRYEAAACVIARTLFQPPYLSTQPSHQGLILHSVYHRPNGWDYVPPGAKVPCGESSMWGDYHALELALLLARAAEGGRYITFFGP